MTTPLPAAALLAALVALPAAGCASDPTDATSATLMQDGVDFQVTDSTYSYDEWLIYGATGEADGAWRYHHLEVVDYGSGTMQLEVGRHYVDGPAVNGRGTVEDHVGDDGVLHGDFPTPWIDVLDCWHGDDGVQDCVRADRTEVWLEATGTDAVRVHYQSMMPGDETWSLGGTFLAVPGGQDG